MTEGYFYKHQRAALTVDALVFRRDTDGYKILLIKRRHEPFKGKWAFPGGFVDIDEKLDDAAARELAEEAGVTGIKLEQLRAFDAIDRDPRERIITIAHYGIAMGSNISPKAGSDAADVGWFDAHNPPPLASDHDQILAFAMEKLRIEGAK